MESQTVDTGNVSHLGDDSRGGAIGGIPMNSKYMSFSAALRSESSSKGFNA